MQPLLPTLEVMEIERLRDQAFLEFDDVADFIWKAPRLIESERRLEAVKLDAYFPDDGGHRQHRKEMEQRKLDATFPYMIASGNLYALLSLFETYLLLLCGEIQNLTGKQLSDTKGQGVSKLLAYFKGCGVAPESQPLHDQVMAALKIRNCLMHASGMLSWSKDAPELRRIVKTMSFLSPEHRQRRKKHADRPPLVNVVSSSLGDRIVVQNIYSHVLCSYLIQYFMSLCETFNVAICARRSGNA